MPARRPRGASAVPGAARPGSTDARSALARHGIRLAALVSMVGVAASMSYGCVAAFRGTRVPSARDSALAITHLRAILDAHWSYAIGQWPELAIRAGLIPGYLPDVSNAAEKYQAQFARAAVRELDEVSVRALPEPMYMSWLVLRDDMELLSRRTAYSGSDLSFAMPPSSPLRTAVQVLRSLPLRSRDDDDRYLKLLGQVPALADTVRLRLAALAASGIRLPRMEVPRVRALVSSLIPGTQASPFLPSSDRLSGLDDVERERMLDAAEETIATGVTPSLERLRTALQGSYEEQAPEAIGLGRYAGGTELYRYLLRVETTLDITPEQAHLIGLQEVARLDTLLRAALRGGGLPPTIDALRRLLATARTRDDSSPVAIARQLAATAAHVDTLMSGHLTGEPLPPLRFRFDTDMDGAGPWPLRVEAPTLADSIPTLTFDPTATQIRVDWLRAALVYEAIRPGRLYLLQRQLADYRLPLYRRVTTRPGTADGWSAYAIEVALSLGAAGTPREGAGALLREREIACGLVIDSGVNYFGWSRDQALTWLREQLPYPDTELEREFILPAIESPGRLAAGALGAREIQGMRVWASTEQGEHFDRARFVDALLSQGAAPLRTLGTHLQWWLWKSSQPVAVDTGDAPSVRPRPR